MSFSGDPRIPKVQLPSTPPPQPAPEKEVGKMGEHSVREDRSSQISAPEQEGEKVSQLAQERLLQEVESTKQLSEQHIVEQSAQKTPTEDDVDKIRQSQLPHSEQQTSLVQESTSASPIISGSVVVRESQKKSPRDQVETEIIPSIVPTGESAAPRSLLTRMAEMKVPGVSIAVIDKGEVVWSEGYGELDEKKHPGVLTQAASVSKVVTALTVLSLCQDGILDLDQDVGQFFREKLGQEGEAIWRQIYPEDSEDPRVPKVTIRMLLSHTSGIPRGGSEYYSIEQIDRQFLIDVSTLVQDFKLLDKKEYSSVKSSLEELVALQEKGKISRSDGINQKITDKQKEVLSALTSIASTLPAEQIPSFNERLVRLTASHECHEEATATPVPSLDAILLGNDKKLGPIRVARRPGEYFEYSNPGFTILQKVVQLASEQRDFVYEVQKRVLGPLHMDDSTYSPPLERAVLGNDTDGKPLAESWRLLPHLAAGGLWTSSRDLAKVILAIQGALAGIPLPGQDKPLISKDLAQIMEQGTDVSRKKSYGLGLMIDIVGQEGQPTTYFSHNGQIRGFRTIVIANELHPEDIEHTGKGVVILTNSLNGEDFYPEIIRAVAKAYNWPDREKIPVCELRVQPSELYASAQEANAPSNKAVWATRVGTYESVLDGVHYYVDVSIEEDSGKVHFLAYEENDGRKIEEGAITCIPIGPSVAYHSPNVQGPFDVVKFTTEGEKTHVDVFGARYTRIPFERNLFSHISGEKIIPGMPAGPFAIDDRMKQLHVPGVGITIIKGGKVVWEKAYGELATPSGEPKIVSQAASMSKTVTALTVLSLIEQCRRKSSQGQPSGLAKDINIDLDTDVREIFTAILGKEETDALWKTIDPSNFSAEPGHEITLRRLLSHTAGLAGGSAPYFNKEGLKAQIQQLEQELLTEESSSPSLPLKQKLAALRAMYEQAEREQPPSTDDLLEGRSKMGKVEVVSQPGTHFEYSNRGIVILQKLVEVLTQKSFAETVKERVLDPLDMTQSTYTSPALGEAAKGHDEEGHTIPGMWYTIPEVAAGGLWTTPSDFTKVELEIQKALLGESRLISRDLAREMITDQVPLPHEEDSSYGLGVYVEETHLLEGHSVTYFSHGGHAPGFHSYMIGNDHGDGVIIMTNAEMGDDLSSEILRSIATAYDWPASDTLKKCQPCLSPEEILPPDHETIGKWVARVQGTYKCWKNQEDKFKKAPDHIVEIRFDQASGKIYADLDGGSTQEGGKTFELFPGGARFVTYLKVPPGMYAICDFSSDEEDTSSEAPFTHHNFLGMNFEREVS